MRRKVEMRYSQEDFIMLPVPLAMFSAVCALIGGASGATLTGGNTGGAGNQARPAPEPDAPKPQGTESVSSGTGNAAPSEPVASGETDAHGHPWSEALHASTKGKTKDGLWRMKVGVSRPAPLPGFPKDANAAPGGSTGTQSNGAGSQAGGSASGPAAGPATPEGEDEDEFAAFRAAAEKTGATDAAAAASVPARKWSDTDLGALCNQAAVKLGDPAPVKAIIGQFVPEGQVPHSRNIPDDKREDFAKAVEAKAGITFAG
jgi:hypothetical protein